MSEIKKAKNELKNILGGTNPTMAEKIKMIRRIKILKNKIANLQQRKILRIDSSFH